MRSLILVWLGWGLLSVTSHASWSVHIGSGKEGHGLRYIGDAEQGRKSLGEALENLRCSADIRKLKSLTVQSLLEDPVFQKELTASLQSIAPDLLRAAQKSAGNMHNPKVIPLRKVFGKAFLATPTLTAWQAALTPHGLKFTEPDFEKLSIQETGGKKHFFCFIWLGVEPITAPANPSAAKP